MLNAPRVIASGLGLALAAWSCSPPCESISPAPERVCHRADAGAVTPDASFVLEATTFVRNGTCKVAVDGGQIALSIDGMACVAANSNGGALAPQAPSVARCEIPALPAGTYVVTSGTPTTFTLPLAADAGLPPCL